MHPRLLGFLSPLLLTGLSNDQTLCASVQEQHAGPSEAARAAEEEQWLSGVRLPVQLGLHVRSDRPAGPTEAHLGLWETFRLMTDAPLAGGTRQSHSRKAGELHSDEDVNNRIHNTETS